MSQINTDAASAFWSGNRFSRSNTLVEADSGEVRMYLYGRLIARRDATCQESCEVTLARFNTATTRSRLREVLRGFAVTIYQRDWYPYLRRTDEKETDEHYMWEHKRYRVSRCGLITEAD